MARKQLSMRRVKLCRTRSWRRSNQALSLLFLLLVPMPVLSMEGESIQARKEFGAALSDMELAYKYAPSEVHKIVGHLKDPEYLDDDSFRYAFFVGKPGVGKSTLAKAVALKSEWRPKYYVPKDFERKGRNATSEKMSKELESIVAEGIETVVIIDEINQLLEHYNSEHYDTDSTSKALWTFLDNQEGNTKFFLIGIMNRADRLPPQVKSRMLARCIIIDPPDTPIFRKELFLSKLLTKRVKLTTEAEQYIDANIGKMNRCTGRDFKEFAIATKVQAVGPQKEACILVDREHLEKAAKFIQRTAKEIKPHREEQTSEEIQRELHEHSIQEQKRLHEDNKKMQQQHFVQQQLMHLHLATNIKSSNIQTGDTISELSKDKEEEYKAFFTQEQLESSKESRKKYATEQVHQRKKAAQEKSCSIM